jgi:aryl-alcohol dehydrogenase-like predicted oxidoreductase
MTTLPQTSYLIHEHQYRSLGTTGIMVSPLGVGTNKWMQGRNDEPVSQVTQSFLDAGGNFFDTAEVYGLGKSERLLGTCLQQNTRPVVVASKFAPWPYRLSRRQFMDALDASLSRLGLLAIDLYYIHWPFTFLRVETLMDMMAQAVEAGKVRAVGVSNFNAEQMRRAAARLARYDIPLAANEVHYSLLHRKPEVNGVLDACRELDVALVAYYPLEAGRLKSEETSSSSSTSTSAKQERDLRKTLTEIANKHGKSVSQVSLNWLLRRDKHVIPIPGATSTCHVLDNVDTLSWEMADEEFAAIDQASSPVVAT